MGNYRIRTTKQISHHEKEKESHHQPTIRAPDNPDNLEITYT